MGEKLRGITRMRGGDLMANGTRTAHNRTSKKTGKVTPVREARIKKPAEKLKSETKASKKKEPAKKILRKATPEHNIATMEKWLAAEFHPDNEGAPEDYVPGTRTVLRWQCSKCGYEWDSRVCDRVRRKNTRYRGCPSCSGRIARPDNNMTVTDPWMAEIFHTAKNDGNPEDYTSRSGKYIWWLCNECGNEWEQKPNNVYASGEGNSCPACTGRVPTADTCMLATHSWLAAEFHPDNEGDPTQYFAGTGKQLRWICSTCSHEWTTRGTDRVALGEGRGCAVCADYSFKPNEPSVLYLMQGKKWGKIGISNSRSFESRMRKHNQHGQYGEVVHIVELDTGEEARTLEAIMKSFIRQSTRVRPREKLDGYTEAFPAHMVETVMSELVSLQYRG
jgi:hypothetical protein